MLDNCKMAHGPSPANGPLKDDMYQDKMWTTVGLDKLQKTLGWTEVRQIVDKNWTHKGLFWYRKIFTKFLVAHCPLTATFWTVVLYVL